MTKTAPPAPALPCGQVTVSLLDRRPLPPNMSPAQLDDAGALDDAIASVAADPHANPIDGGESDEDLTLDDLVGEVPAAQERDEHPQEEVEEAEEASASAEEAAADEAASIDEVEPRQQAEQRAAAEASDGEASDASDSSKENMPQFAPRRRPLPPSCRPSRRRSLLGSRGQPATPPRPAHRRPPSRLPSRPQRQPEPLGQLRGWRLASSAR